MGSIESSFQFVGYKIDHISFDVHQSLGALGFPPSFPADQIRLHLSFRPPSYFKEKRLFVGGLDLEFQIPYGVGELAKETFCQGTFGIAGAFHLAVEDLDQIVVEKIVKIQIPAILLPYLRATVTSTLAHSGIGSVMLPLINVQKFAEEALKDVPIEVLLASPPATIPKLPPIGSPDTKPTS